MTITAVALALYRLQQGTYPESLDQLVPDLLAEVPIDAFADAPDLWQRIGADGYAGAGEAVEIGRELVGL